MSGRLAVTFEFFPHDFQQFRNICDELDGMTVRII